MRMSAPTNIAQAEREAAQAAEAVSKAEARLAATGGGVSSGALHKLRDAFRHADLAARGARERAERERQAARLGGLEEVGAQVDAFAATAVAGLSDAVAEVAAACARVRELGAGHDAAVADLIAAANDLDVELRAPGGPRKPSAFVATGPGAIQHRTTEVRQLGAAVEAVIGHAAGGRVDDAMAAAVVVQDVKPARADHYYRGLNGAIIGLDDPVNAGMAAQITAGDLKELSAAEVTRFLAGELE
jgi:hypothetical protein